MENIREEIINEIHRKAYKKFPRKHVKVFGIDDLWQIDLFEMIPYSKYNSGYKYILLVIDCFSKYVFVRKLKSKNGLEVTNQMKSIFTEHKRSPSHIQSDLGREFYNKNFKDLMIKYKINHYSSFTHLKAQIAERMGRTLKDRLWKAFLRQGSYNWVKILDEIIDSYNGTRHSTIKTSPNKVKKRNEKMIYENIYKKMYDERLKISKRPKFSVGDYVRISRFKDIFEKGYTPKYTFEIFKVTNVNKKFPFTYLLEDYDLNPIAGQFYEKELTRVKYPHHYLIERVLKKKGKKSLVKYMGFEDNKYNQWINSDEVI